MIPYMCVNTLQVHSMFDEFLVGHVSASSDHWGSKDNSSYSSNIVSFEFSEFGSLYDFCSHRNFPKKLDVVYLETPKVLRDLDQ